MDRFRLKNVIILILILTDLALMGALVYRRTVAQSVHIRGAEELSALLAAVATRVKLAASSWGKA